MENLNNESEIRILTQGDEVEIFFPPGAAQNISTTVSQAYSGDLRRDVNGNLVDLTRAQLRKFNISLSATGQALPDLRQLWRGQLARVAIPATWNAFFPASLEQVQLERTPFGTPRLTSLDGAGPLPSVSVDAETGAVVRGAWPAGSTPRDLVLEYQPILSCRIGSVTVSGSEWDASASWSLELEEV